MSPAVADARNRLLQTFRDWDRIAKQASAKRPA